jgi:hypothetical protein
VGEMLRAPDAHLGDVLETDEQGSEDTSGGRGHGPMAAGCLSRSGT